MAPPHNIQQQNEKSMNFKMANKRTNHKFRNPRMTLPE